MPAAALLLALALGAETQLDAGVRLEAAARRTDPPVFSDERNAVDLTALPRASLLVTGRGATLSAAYVPRLSILAVGVRDRTEQLHEGELRLSLGRGAVFRVEAFGTGAAGRSDLVRESLGATPGGSGTIPTLSVQQIDLERWRTGLSASLAPDRRTELLLAGALAQDGGTNADSRAVYPVARTIDATAELRWSATRLDRLGVLLAAAEARVASRRADSAWAQSLATWRRRLSPRAEAWSGAGAVLLVSRLPPAPDAPPTAPRTTDRDVEPAAQLGVTLAGEPSQRTGELAATLGASVDRLTGRATPQAQARASLRWPFTRAVAFTASGSGTLSWTDAGRTRTGLLELGVSFAVLPRVRLGLGGSGAWQRSTDPAVGRLDSYAATLSLSADAPPLRF